LDLDLEGIFDASGMRMSEIGVLGDRDV
jgi:hypothetical protein